MSNVLLRVEHLGMSFGGLKAVDDVDLDVPAGEITALIGPNGAGKSTFFNVVSGFCTPTTGRVTLFKTLPSIWKQAASKSTAWVQGS